VTLAELKSDIQDWLQCSETTLVSNLEDIIRSAEKRICGRVMMPDAKSSATATTASGTATVTFTTTNLLAPLRAWLTVSTVTKPPMIRKNVGWLREITPGAVTGEPQFYAWTLSSATAPTFLLYPVPAGAYTVNLEYLKGVPPSLVDAETWLSTNYEDTLRKVAVHEAAIYLKDGDLMDRYKIDAEEAIAALGQVVGAPQKDEFQPV
jgi:hypothetical protein